MTASTLPPEVISECVERLLKIMAEGARDVATLNRATAALLAGKATPGRVAMVLKRYASAGQYCDDEVKEIADLITAAKPVPKPMRRRLLKRRVAAQEGNVVYLREGGKGRPASNGQDDHPAPAA